MRERRLQDIGESHTNQMHACVFGIFRLKNKGSQEIVITNKRARAILAMLCLAPDEPLEREFISHLLWPGRFEAKLWQVCVNVYSNWVRCLLTKKTQC